MNRATRIVASILIGLAVFLLSCVVITLLTELLPLYGGTEGGGDAFLHLALLSIGFVVAIGVGLYAAGRLRSRLSRV